MKKAAKQVRKAERKLGKRSKNKAVAQGLAVMARKMGNRNRPRSKMLANPFRQAGLNNYMERLARAPAAQQRSYSIGAPSFNGGKPIVIRHREYLQPIVTVTAFTGAGRYIVQPGLVDNFPWLGQIAGAFENYLFSDVKYVYRNRTGTNNATTIYTATQYDVADPEFASIDEIMTYAGARSEVGWRDFSVDANLKRGRAYKKYLTRTDVLPTGQDYQPYDSALFTICAVSGTAGTYVGDLLVEYTIQFWNPKQNPNMVGAYGANAKIPSSISSATWSAAPFAGYNAAKSVYFPEALAPVVDEVKTITFPLPGTYDIGYHLHQDNAGSFSITSMVWALVNTAQGVLTVLDNSGVGSNTTWIKLTVLVAGCALRLTPTATGTAGTTPTTYLTIAVEAANFILNFQSKNPSLVMSPDALLNLHKRYPKHDLLWAEKAAERYQAQQLEVKTRPLEILPEPPVQESSDEEQEIVRRSASRDKKSRKLDFQKPDPEHGRK